MRGQIQFSSTRERASLMIYTSLVVLVLGVVSWTYFSEQHQARSRALERINSISATIAANTEARRISRIIDNYPASSSLQTKTRDAWYYTTHINLLRTAEANKLATPIRILVRQHSRIQELVSSSKTMNFRKVYDENSNVIAHYFKTGGGANLIDAKVPRWVSISPIIDRNNETIAVVCVELSHAVVRAETIQKTAKHGLLSCFFALLVGFVLKRKLLQWIDSDYAKTKRLKSRNEDIQHSLIYAKKIQKALIPDPAVYENNFTDHFLIDKPKEAISGDFHWFKKLDEHRTLVAITDCTGHGLPGAMMVAVGCSSLNEVIDEDSWQTPADILSQLNKKIMSHLSQEEGKKGSGEGMDMALCLIDSRDRTMLFAGAYRPLYWLSKDNLTVINGDRKPIGGSQYGANRKFTCHQLSYKQGDRIYLFSDGYVDQFGGPDNRKFLTTRLNDLISKNQHLSLTAQAKLLESAFDNWKGTEEQVDDVCMLAVELN